LGFKDLYVLHLTKVLHFTTTHTLFFDTNTLLDARFLLDILSSSKSTALAVRHCGHEESDVTTSRHTTCRLTLGTVEAPTRGVSRDCVQSAKPSDVLRHLILGSRCHGQTSSILRARPSLHTSSAHDYTNQCSLFERWLVPEERAVKLKTFYRITIHHASRRLLATMPCWPLLDISGPCRVNYSMLRISTHHCTNVASG